MQQTLLFVLPPEGAGDHRAPPKPACLAYAVFAGKETLTGLMPTTTHALPAIWSHAATKRFSGLKIAVIFCHLSRDSFMVEPDT